MGRFHLDQILNLTFITLNAVTLIVTALSRHRRLRHVRHSSLICISQQSPSLIITIMLTTLNDVTFLTVLVDP